MTDLSGEDRYVTLGVTDTARREADGGMRPFIRERMLRALQATSAFYVVRRGEADLDPSEGGVLYFTGFAGPKAVEYGQRLRRLRKLDSRSIV